MLGLGLGPLPTCWSARTLPRATAPSTSSQSSLTSLRPGSGAGRSPSGSQCTASPRTTIPSVRPPPAPPSPPKMRASPNTLCRTAVVHSCPVSRPQLQQSRGSVSRHGCARQHAPRDPRLCPPATRTHPRHRHVSDPASAQPPGLGRQSILRPVSKVL